MHRFRKFVVFLALAFPFFGTQAGAESFEERTIRGWKVFIEADLAADRAALDPMLSRLESQLADIVNKVPSPQLSILRETPFWLVEDDTYADRHDLLGLFFFSREWLVANGYDPAKHLGIQFNKRFGMEASQNIVFHELAHAFHTRSVGLENAELEDLFEQTKKSTKRARDRCPREGGVYAFSNIDEFFATFSQAYFGGTCAYPNNRNLLRLKHPEMLAFLKRVWGF